MTRKRFHNGRILLADGELADGVVEVERGRFSAVFPRSSVLVGDCETVDLNGGYLAPGFIDLHVHGGGWG